ncbi:MAG: hypothetical protein CSA62_15310 [Planctomycetota bacterium]|nr:MAG: hypothetical protein CSA62_15310 [Planctomycetota bacterium]
MSMLTKSILPKSFLSKSMLRRGSAALALLGAAVLPPQAARAQEHKGSKNYPPLTIKQRLGPPAPQAQRTLHPRIPLLDVDGSLVIKSKKPLSLAKSCGACHDAKYIAEHSYHASLGWDEIYSQRPKDRPWDSGPGPFRRWDPLRNTTLHGLYSDPAKAHGMPPGIAEWQRRFGRYHAGGGPASKIEFNCLLCHMASPNHDERARELSAARFEASSMATLIGTGLVIRDSQGQLQWQPQQLDKQGAVAPEQLGLGRPRNENCRACHMGPGRYQDAVHFGFRAENRSAATTGTVFAAERIFDSGMNLAAKEGLATPFDVHAERLVGCADCHHSPNSPVHGAGGSGSEAAPAHLRFDARRASTGEWLLRPNHDFVKGMTSQGTIARRMAGSMRGCADCHDTEQSHPKLPHQDLHFAKLSCSACHVPQVYGAARRMTDWTLLGPEQQPLVGYRGTTGDPNEPSTLIQGYRPILLWQERGDGERKLAPHNLMASWFWTETPKAASDSPAKSSGKRSQDQAAQQPSELERPISQKTLAQALFTPEGAYRPEIIAALDGNADGKLQRKELRLDGPDKLTAVRQRLEAVGVQQPRIRAQLQPYSIAHGVQSTPFALRQCTECHGQQSRVAASLPLSEYIPGDVLPSLVSDARLVKQGKLERKPDGWLHYQAEPMPDLAYLHGAQSFSLLDRIGLGVLLLCCLLSLIHGGLRVLAQLRRRQRISS